MNIDCRLTVWRADDPPEVPGITGGTRTALRQRTAVGLARLEIFKSSGVWFSRPIPEVGEVFRGPARNLRACSRKSHAA